MDNSHEDNEINEPVHHPDEALDEDHIEVDTHMHNSACYEAEINETAPGPSEVLDEDNIDVDAPIDAPGTSTKVVKVVILTPSKTWIATEDDEGSQIADTQPEDSPPVEALKDDNGSVFSMSHYGPLDWDHSGDEFENITVTPKTMRRHSVISLGGDVETLAEGIPNPSRRKRSSLPNPSRSEKRSSSVLRDANGRFSPRDKAIKPVKENTSVSSKKKRSLPKSDNTVSSHGKTLDVKRDSNGRFTKKQRLEVPDPDSKPPVPKNTDPSKSFAEALDEAISIPQTDKNGGSAPKVRKKKLPTKSPYFTPPVSPLKENELETANNVGELGESSIKKTPKKRNLSKLSKLERLNTEDDEISSSNESPKTRSPGGLVSCIPFPPLSAPHFGLIQENLAHNPFRLLIAVTFLIRTHGKHAIPVFYSLMEKCPTPESLAEADKNDILPIIRHLGLQNQRATTYQTYANIWLKNPPVKGRRYAVRGYPAKDSGRNVKKDEILSDDDEREAWEIGHMTQGPYAIDSWRIFCRDVLRGESESWNGEGSRKEGFQPEWMRVLPQDKELRAYLRWMWLKEGFEWDPFTGEKEVASPELMRAAFEGRIAWDDRGGMRILDKVMDLQPGGLSQIGSLGDAVFDLKAKLKGIGILGDVDDALMEVLQDEKDE